MVTQLIGRGENPAYERKYLTRIKAWESKGWLSTSKANAAISRAGEFGIPKIVVDYSETIVMKTTKDTNIQTIRLKDLDFETDLFRFISGGTTKGVSSLLIKKLREIKHSSLAIGPALQKIGADFFATNEEEIFSQYGEGQTPFFDDYNPIGMSAKFKRNTITGGMYPILVDHGDLMDSLTNSGSSEDRVEQITGNQLTIGTTNPKAKWNADGHQGFMGTQVPPRNPVQVNPPGSGRQDRWVNILNDYIISGGKKGGY